MGFETEANIAPVKQKPSVGTTEIPGESETPNTPWEPRIHEQMKKLCVEFSLSRALDKNPDTHSSDIPFVEELARLETIVLTGDMIEDTRQVLEAQSVDASTMKKLLQTGNKILLKTKIEEWVRGIDSALKESGQADQKAPLKNDWHNAMLAKKLDLLNSILKSAEKASGSFGQAENRN